MYNKKKISKYIQVFILAFLLPILNNISMKNLIHLYHYKVVILKTLDILIVFKSLKKEMKKQTRTQIWSILESWEHKL